MPRADFQRLGTGICAVKVKLTMQLEIEADPATSGGSDSFRSL